MCKPSISKWQNKQLDLWSQSKSVKKKKPTAFSESLWPALWEMLSSSAYEPEKKETSYFLDFASLAPGLRASTTAPCIPLGFSLTKFIGLF